MAGLASAKIEPETHLLLDQTLLSMPFQLARKMQKSAQRAIEKETAALSKELQSAAQAAASAISSNSEPKSVEALNGMINRMKGLKRKLSDLHEEEIKLHRQSKARIAHLQSLYEIPSALDVKYDAWSRTRLSRLLVDYLLRNGYEKSAGQLAKEMGIEELVDVEAFELCLKIERSLKEGHRTNEALRWCQENGPQLKKVQSSLEFELRLQQYIELVRQGNGGAAGAALDSLDDEDGAVGGFDVAKLRQATEHARKYLSGSADMDVLGRAAGLLAFNMNTEVSPYKNLYSPSRWTFLASLFLETHNSLYNLPPRPLLQIALSAGLSALKTPACHSRYASSTGNANSSSTTVCPICSTELNELARNVPYAQHSKSIVENDLVVLPNGRIYGSERLREYNEKVGTEQGWVRDPMDGSGGEKFKAEDVRKVYIS